MDITYKLKKERSINASINSVWEVLTNAKYIERWLGVKTESSWKPDSEINFEFTWDGKDYIDKGIIIKFEKGKQFQYRYWSVFSGLPDKAENYSLVNFEIEASESGTILELTHCDLKSETMYIHSNQNWEETLNEIKKIAEEQIR